MVLIFNGMSSDLPRIYMVGTLLVRTTIDEPRRSLRGAQQQRDVLEPDHLLDDGMIHSIRLEDCE